MSGVRSPHPPSTGHSAAGSASGLGPEGRRFESCCPDKYEKLLKYFQELFCFKFSFIKTIKPGQQDSKPKERRPGGRKSGHGCPRQRRRPARREQAGGLLLASGKNNLHESGEINQKKSKEKSHYQF